MEDMRMENYEVLDERIGLSDDGCMLSSSSFKGCDNMGNDSAFYEKFILDDWDAYWDDLNGRLAVSRMVSDSVIKGMVGALAEEAADRIASKDAEIVALNERLCSREFDADEVDKSDSSVTVSRSSVVKVDDPHTIKSGLQGSYLDEHLGSLRIAVEEQLRLLKKPLETMRSLLSPVGKVSCYVDARWGEIVPQSKATEILLEIDGRVDGLKSTVAVVFDRFSDMFTSLKTTKCEQQWEHDIQREVLTTAIQDSIRGLHDGFGAMFCEQRRLIDTLNSNWQKKAAELSTLREDLDAVSRSLFSSEGGLHSPGNSHEILEEWNTTKRKDQFNQEIFGGLHVPSTSHLEENGSISMDKHGDFGNHMAKEGLIDYLKNEMLKMRRQYESDLHEKTEELFRLKREYLKEKGSSPIRKDKEYELLRKKIPEVVLKLDGILLEEEKFPMTLADHDELCGFKDRIDTLLFENQRLRGLLTNKGKEVKCLSSQVSDATSLVSLHSLVKEDFLKQIELLKGEWEDMKIESNVRDEVNRILFKELISESIYGTEDIQFETKIVQEIYSSILQGVVGVARSTVDPIMSKCYTEKASLEVALFEMEKALCLEMEENKKMKDDILSFSTLMKENEKLVLEAGLNLMQQKEHFDLVTDELCMLRDQLTKQEALSSEKEAELDSMKSRVNETARQRHQYEMEINKLNNNFMIASDALEEAEKQKSILCGTIEEKQKALLSSITRDTEQKKEMKCIITFAMELSRAIADSESRLTEIIERNESRLKLLSYECSSLTEQASLLRKKELSYIHFLELKSSNLQKAEHEVDLLGDEVDALLSLLGKIYITLDHYAPVFELYPGVMDILKLVQRELKGETVRLV